MRATAFAAVEIEHHDVYSDFREMPVHCADEGITAAANHAHAQALALDGLAHCGVDHSL
jgi:hypothetical protein